MSGFGRFLELSVRAPDILDSLEFYRALGFRELASADIWQHKYTVVSDGAISIGLHDRVFDSPSLTFVQPELAKHARSMSEAGFDFSFMRLDEDVFNEIGLCDRDGHSITMLEARTFHSGDEDDDDTACGSWFELALPVRDALRGARFWGPVTRVMLDMREEPTTHLRFDAGGMSLGLSESIALESPSLCFKCRDREALMSIVELRGLKHKRFPGFEGAFLALKAPEGTMLYLFDEDFLGEPIEVEESGDLADFPHA